MINDKKYTLPYWYYISIYTVCAYYLYSLSVWFLFMARCTFYHLSFTSIRFTLLNLVYSTNKTCRHDIIGNIFKQYWACLMKVVLSMPDEGYSEHVWWRLFWACLMKVVLSMSDEGCSEHAWWRSEQPSSGMLRTTFIRHAQNNLHQACSE
jgi:hypothetical protein